MLYSNAGPASLGEGGAGGEASKVLGSESELGKSSSEVCPAHGTQGSMLPRRAVNAAQHKTPNLLKTWEGFAVCSANRWYSSGMRTSQMAVPCCNVRSGPGIPLAPLASGP